MTTDSPRRTLWAWLVATFFGAGFLKPGPGTYGSVAAAALWLGWFSFHPAQPLQRALLTLAAALIVTLVGIPASTIAARESGRKDPGFVVIDEVAGQLVALTVAPASLPFVLLAFVLFRVFDISKPWPIRKFEKLPEGTGIVVDDLVAGLFALAVYALLSAPFAHLVLRTH